MTRNETEHYNSNLALPSVTWDGSATSDEVDLGGCAFLGVDLPAGFTGALLTIHRYSPLNEAYEEVLVNGAALSLVVTASKTALLASPAQAVALEKIKLISDQVETCVGQVLAAKVV